MELADADVVIAPVVSPSGINDASGRELARRKGYDAAVAALPAVQAAIQAHSSVVEQ
jgi:NTE family protein